MLVFRRAEPDIDVFCALTVFTTSERDADDSGVHWSRATIDPDDSRRPSAMVTREAFQTSQQTTLC